jgi:hypothetical protein
MDNRWNGGDGRPPRRGRPSRDDLPGGDDRVDPVDLMAMGADDELLDALGSGKSLVGPVPYDPHLDADGYAEDQAVLALLGSWKRDVEVDTFPELFTIEEAAVAIAAGQRAESRPRRRLMPVATAAAVAVLALAGVGVAAGDATPGSPLWGISRLLNGQRAQSIEAVQMVDVALTSAQRSLAEGKVDQARKTLADVAPELNKIQDQQSKRQLLDKSQNLQDAASDTSEGQLVATDPDGIPTDPYLRAQSLRRHRQPGGDSDRNQSGDTRGSSSSSSGADSTKTNGDGSTSSSPTDSNSGTPGRPDERDSARQNGGGVSSGIPTAPPTGSAPTGSAPTGSAPTGSAPTGERSPGRLGHQSPPNTGKGHPRPTGGREPSGSGSDRGDNSSGDQNRHNSLGDRSANGSGDHGGMRHGEGGGGNGGGGNGGEHRGGGNGGGGNGGEHRGGRAEGFSDPGISGPSGR